MILINCDIGERGADHPVDVELMDHIGMANVACGGHAGDAESVAAFLKKAQQKGVKVAAHLSYPDRKNFGRITMAISREDLCESLNRQMDLMPLVRTVKFHGALYNDANVDRELAGLLAEWMKTRGIMEVVAPFDSELAAASKALGLKVISEAFAERRYQYDPVKGRLALVARNRSHASIKDCDEAVEQVRGIMKSGKVRAHMGDDEGNLATKNVPIEAETICIHSDSEIALELAKRLEAVAREGLL